jgi:hypothetical protein
MRLGPELKLGAAERSLPVSRQLEEARRAHAAAAEHKRLSRQHHRAQVDAKRRFDAFKANLEVMGITVIIEEAHTSHEGGNSGNRDDSN